MSAVADPFGVRLLKVGPLRVSFLTPPVWQPPGVGPGGLATVSENVPVAVDPSASVTVTLNVDVPSVVGDPRTSPEGLSARPAGTAPDHGYGEGAPPARKPGGEKMLSNTLLPAPRSHPPVVHGMNRGGVGSGGGGFCPP